MERGQSSESNDRGLLSTVVGGDGFMFDSDREGSWNETDREKNINKNLMVLIMRGCVCLLHDNLREINVKFKTRGGVSVISIDLMGGDCNFPLMLTFYISRYIWIRGI